MQPTENELTPNATQAMKKLFFMDDSMDGWFVRLPRAKYIKDTHSAR